jgi:hypothetical protein
VKPFYVYPKASIIVYKLQVIDRDKVTNSIKVHYIGFSEEYDEWRDCGELLENNNLGRVRRRYSATDKSLHDRSSLFFDRLGRNIKHSLFATKRESPEIRLEEVCEQDIFDNYLKSIGEVKKCRGREIHCVNNVTNQDMENILGDKWYERILNKNKDFSYVVKGTIQFWLHQKAPIKEFVTVGNQLIENEIENDLILVFTFVREDGTGKDYDTAVWK